MAAEDLHKRINMRGTVDAWARYAIAAFQSQLKKKRVGQSQQLFNSFARELKLSGGDVTAVMIRFNFYGRFRDMGVGRGVSSHEVKSNKQNLIAAKKYGADVDYTRRQPKRWYAKEKVHQTLRLKEILIKEMGIELVNGLENSLAANLKITL
jgi:hypothetical protein